MQKNEKNAIFDTRKIVFMALFVAMHIVLTRVFAIDLGFLRITLGSVVTILAGIWLGPVAGGVCGLAADLLGCLLKGYAVNPFISVAAVLWGVIPGLVMVYAAKQGVTGKKKTFLICASIVVTSICSSLILTTAGLVLMLGYEFAVIMPGRLVQWAGTVPVYCIVTCALYYSPLTAFIHNALPENKKGYAGI